MKNGCLFFVFFVVLSIPCHSQVNVRDSFETPELSKLWAKDRMVADAIQMQPAIVRSGHSAAKITLKPGDVFEAGKGKSPDSERDELREANNLVSAEDISYEYKFSLFLPDSFPIVPTRLVISQWKQYCPGGICDDDSPVLAIRYVSGKLYITIKTDAGEDTVFQTKDEIRNKWLDFTFNARFSKSANGHVYTWLNGKQIVSYNGITCYSEKKGYTGKNHFFFKMGLYRDLMPQLMSIYIDDYSKKQLAAE